MARKLTTSNMAEQIFTNKHNIQMAKSGEVLLDTLTFGDYGIKKSDVPFELTLKFTLDPGVQGTYHKSV